MLICGILFTADHLAKPISITGSSSSSSDGYYGKNLPGDVLGLFSHDRYIELWSTKTAVKIMNKKVLSIYLKCVRLCCYITVPYHWSDFVSTFLLLHLPMAIDIVLYFIAL